MREGELGSHETTSSSDEEDEEIRRQLWLAWVDRGRDETEGGEGEAEVREGEGGEGETEVGEAEGDVKAGKVEG